MQFGGVKEFFMEPLNVFLDKSRDRLNDFLESLTRVDNLSEHLMVWKRRRNGEKKRFLICSYLQLDKYLALGKTSDTTINISLNEMYFVHALLNTHVDILVFFSPPITLLCPCYFSSSFIFLQALEKDNPLRQILADLGKAPDQLPRGENATVDLKLSNRFENERT